MILWSSSTGVKLMHPNRYNAAQRLLERGIAAAGPRNIAFIDDDGEYSYADLRERVGRCAHALLAEGLEPGERILLVLLDSIDFPTTFLGAIAAGIVPVPTNTMLPARDLAFLLRDSQAAAVVVSGALADRVREAAMIADWNGKVIVSGPALSALLERAGTNYDDPPTTEDSPCFWLYSSGSTGKPKGAIHRHGSLLATAELFAVPVLELHTLVGHFWTARAWKSSTGSARRRCCISSSPPDRERGALAPRDSQCRAIGSASSTSGAHW